MSNSKTIIKNLKLLAIIISILIVPVFVLADSEKNHQNEIERGRQLVASKASCDELTEEDLEAIGEYLMEQMHPGESHEAMHQMMGMEEGTEYHKNFHVNMAKNMYCGETGTMGMMGSGGMMGAMPMMNMVKGDGNSTMGNMMGWNNLGMGSGWGWFGWAFMILFWILIIIAIIALIKWLINQMRGGRKEKSALDILKERYARGEIDKKEFEEKKKYLN